MKKQLKTLLQSSPLLFFAVLMAPNLAQAHLTGGSGMLSGLAHPIFGIDHLLAMVAVGIVATQLGKKALWKVPMSFLVFMMLGGVLAMTGIKLPLVESGIALSVLILGVAIVLSGRFSTNGAMACVGLFALFHGHAHGTEMPLAAQPALYALGFVLSTAALHLGGVLMGHYAKKTQLTAGMLRYAGAGVAVFGVTILLGF